MLVFRLFRSWYILMDVHPWKFEGSSVFGGFAFFFSRTLSNCHLQNEVLNCHIHQPCTPTCGNTYDIGSGCLSSFVEDSWPGVELWDVMWVSLLVHATSHHQTVQFFCFAHFNPSNPGCGEHLQDHRKPTGKPEPQLGTLSTIRRMWVWNKAWQAV